MRSPRPHDGGADSARPHTGRRRNEAARRAILDATFRLLRDTSGHDFTIDAIAETAGVGRQTIYRWWPSKGALIAEAMAERAQATARVPDTGSIRGDLRTFLADTFVGASKPANRRMLCQLMAAAQQDSYLADAAADFTATRRGELRSLLRRAQNRGELPDAANVDILVDLAYGFLWYRLLLDHAPLDRGIAYELADHLLAAATPNHDAPGGATGP